MLSPFTWYANYYSIIKNIVSCRKKLKAVKLLNPKNGKYYISGVDPDKSGHNGSPGWFGPVINTNKMKTSNFLCIGPLPPLLTTCNRSSKCLNNFVLNTKVTCEKFDIVFNFAPQEHTNILQSFVSFVYQFLVYQFLSVASNSGWYLSSNKLYTLLVLFIPIDAT